MEKFTPNKYLCEDYVGKKVIIKYNFGSYYNRVGVIKSLSSFGKPYKNYTHIILTKPETNRISLFDLYISDLPEHEKYSWIPYRKKIG